MVIIAIANQKGGVGKTTTAINLAAALADLGRRILLIDLDPQANTTSGLGIAPEPGCSIYPAMIGAAPAAAQVRPTPRANLSLIPAEIDLAGCEVEIARLDQPLLRLREVLDPLHHSADFDYAVIDCPPSLGILMTNALAAADRLLVPVQCEYYALEGIGKILDLITKMQSQGLNPALQLLGVLMTMFDARTRLSQQVAGDLQQHLGEGVFRTIIPRSIRLGEAPSFGQTIFDYDPHGLGAAAYRQLATEVLERLEGSIPSAPA